MERLEGIILRQDFPEGFELGESEANRLCHNVIDKLVDLHRVDYQAAGLDQIGKGAGYVKRQIDGWSDRFRKARTEDVADFETVMAWLQERCRRMWPPASSTTTSASTTLSSTRTTPSK